jgi:methyl-galactoside transport system substrate-binding protein
MYRRKTWLTLIAGAVFVAGCTTGGGSSAAPTGAAPSGGGEAPPAGDLTVGVAVFQFSNTYLTLVRNAISEQAAEKGIAVDVVDGQNAQPTQNEQIDLFISKKYAAMAINQVDRELANVTLDKAKAADIPVVFFNKEPAVEVLDAWPDNAYYVGAKAEESGVIQGEMIAEYWAANPDTDRNGDGKIQYVMLQGPADHQDAQLRTEWSIKTLEEAGVGLEELALEIGDWSRPVAQEDMGAILAAHGDAIEFVIANNDDMALGAIEALRANGYFTGDKYMPVVGVDATAPALEALEEGTMLGTVLNDAVNQGKATLNLAYDLANGVTPTEATAGYPITDGKYVWVPYKKILKENISDAQ